MIDFQRPRKRTFVGAKIFTLGLLLALLLGSATVVYIYSKMNSARTQESHERTFTIDKGETVGQIAARLEQGNLIGSALVFRFYSSVSGRAGKIQAGTFILDSNMTAKEILLVLTLGQGSGNEVRLTFTEGMSVNEVAQKIEKSGLASVASFKKAQASFANMTNYSFLSDRPKSRDLEGYLFPDTYNFSKDADEEEVIGVMLMNFDRRVTTELRHAITQQGKTIFEILTLAAIVEGEVGRNYKSGEVLPDADIAKLLQERKLVAGVFYNRLAIGQALQSDATINYITHKGTTRPSIDDTKVESPYNTYAHRGLPPGPINNPSLDSIMAAVYPAKTDYFYFLSKADGEMVFSKTLDEHNANKAKYLN